jgi:hypothetical protein
MRVTVALMMVAIAVDGAATTGCSLLYTKGPQPEMHPPPPCTTSNDAPIADTVFAVVSVGTVAGGLIAYKNGDLGIGLLGAGGAILGGVGTLVFVPSAVVGYNRTAACREWVEKGVKSAPPAHPPARLPPRSSSLLEPPCSSRGDAPLLCSEGTL